MHQAIGRGGSLTSRLRRLLPSLRPSVVFSSPWYVWAVASNLLLRLSWTHRLLGDLEAMSVVALAVAMLEVLRRYQWAFIRVETELRKLRGKAGLHPPQAPLVLELASSASASAGVEEVTLHEVKHGPQSPPRSLAGM